MQAALQWKDGAMNELTPYTQRYWPEHAVIPTEIFLNIVPTASGITKLRLQSHDNLYNAPLTFCLTIFKMIYI